MHPDNNEAALQKYGANPWIRRLTPCQRDMVFSMDMAYPLDNSGIEETICVSSPRFHSWLSVCIHNNSIPISLVIMPTTSYITYTVQLGFRWVCGRLGTISYGLHTLEYMRRATVPKMHRANGAGSAAWVHLTHCMKLMWGILFAVVVPLTPLRV